MNWTEFWNTILGDLTIEQTFAYFVMMCLGAFVNFALDVRHSVRKDPKTSKRFRFWFMVRDNFFRGLGVLIMIAVMVLYFEDWFDTTLNGKMAFVFGLSIDVIIGKLVSEGKDTPVIKKSRDKLLSKYQ